MIARILIAVAILSAAPAASAADVLASRTLRIGTVLTEGDLSVRNDAAKPHLAEMVGLEVRRAIYVGRPINRDDLGPPTLVRRNEIVTMHYRAGSLGLRAEGRALGAGGRGEVIEVMNLTSRQTVRAMVRNRRTVEVATR